MEIFAVVLSGLLGIAGAPGVVIDSLITNALRSNLVRADRLEVRLDNTPNYQILEGKIDRVRIAGRGLYLSSFLRIDSVDLESDPISINPGFLQSGQLILVEPAQAAFRVILKSEDINLALKSPAIAKTLQGIKFSLSPGAPAEEFDLINPEVIFLGDNRLRLNAVLQPQNSPQNSSKNSPQNSPQNSKAQPGLQVTIESKIVVTDSTRVELTASTINLQQVEVPSQITNSLAQSINRLLDFKQLEASGILARILKLEVTNSQMQLIGFVRMEPQKP